MIYQCDECAFKTNLKSKFMRHKRFNKCKCTVYESKKNVQSSDAVTMTTPVVTSHMTNISSEMNYYLKNGYIDHLEKTYTEDVTLNIRKKKEEPDKFVNISNKTLLNILVWYYIHIFNLKIEKLKINMKEEDLDTYFKKFLQLECERSIEYREYKIQLMQESIYCFSERYEYDLTSGFENIF